MRLINLAILFCLLSSLMLVPVNGQSQEDLKIKTDEALKVFNKNIPQGLARLRELGAPAVPYVLDYVRSADRSLAKIVLLSFVSSVNGKEADEAILSLLNEKDPYLRGYAASSVGTRKIEVAVPRLVELLQDKEVYLHVVVNDGVDYDVLIRDKAIEALESINGLILEKKGSQDRKARAWARWWQKQQTRSAGNSHHAAKQVSA